MNGYYKHCVSRSPISVSFFRFISFYLVTRVVVFCLLGTEETKNADTCVKSTLISHWNSNATVRTPAVDRFSRQNIPVFVSQTNGFVLCVVCLLNLYRIYLEYSHERTISNKFYGNLDGFFSSLSSLMNVQWTTHSSDSYGDIGPN